MNVKDEHNYSMLADFYQFSMGNGYFEAGVGEEIVYFDMFFRSIPDDGGFAIFAGLEQLIDYFENLHFNKEDIDYLRSRDLFDEGFLNYLENFKFSCDVWAMPEGTVIFPQEPLLIVRGPLIQAQLIETAVLLNLNHQSLIATKANRICRAARGKPVSEFGSRRAQGYSAANLGARAAYIGGCSGTANTMADLLYGVPAVGTMAHSWVQSFTTELEAFRTYAKTYPDNCLLLIDTYDTINQGLPNAIKVFDELRERGHEPLGVRIDSGDLAYLSKKVRQGLDAAGYEGAKIMLSSSLDEYVIDDLLKQDTPVDSFGVGERLITSKSNPVFGGVYKLVAVEKDGQVEPRIKVSDNVSKITNPGFKNVYRFYDRETNNALADVVTLHDEAIDKEEYEIFHPLFTWKRRLLTNYEVRPLLRQIYKGGELVYKVPSLEEVKENVNMELSTLWETNLRFTNPSEYMVDLSYDLWKMRDDLLDQHS